MADLTVENLVREIHAKPGRMVLAVTGGGSRVIGELLSVPGGSRTVLEALVPYSEAALVEFLRCRPEQFCSARTARLMAMGAFQRARRLAQGDAGEAKPLPGGTSEAHRAGDSLARTGEEDGELVGIGCTASLTSDRPKHGAHRIHVAIQTAQGTASFSVELIKGRRSRPEEEEIAARMVLNAVAEATGVEQHLTLTLDASEKIDSRCDIASEHWRDLFLGKIEAVTQSPTAGGKLVSEKARDKLQAVTGPEIIFPGAFNPLHSGHLQMWAAAGRRIGVSPWFEISIENVDKSSLDYTEMALRAEQFSERKLPLWFTRAPTFDEKSRLFPGATFIVGADTLLRIAQRKYYHNDAATAEAAFKRIAERGCRFLVFGRMLDGKFETLADLELPESLRKLCDEVPGEEFREDVSSTEVRRGAM